MKTSFLFSIRLSLPLFNDARRILSAGLFGTVPQNAGRPDGTPAKYTGKP